MTKDTGGPAFPQNDLSQYNMGPEGIGDGMGMNLRQYAAIKLRVPDSGLDWLDNMIREGRRMDYAGQALAGILAGGFADTVPHDDIAGGADAAAFAHQYADAMLAERNK